MARLSSASSPRERHIARARWSRRTAGSAPPRLRERRRNEDSGTTAGIYEQEIDDSDHAVALLESVIGYDLAEAHDVFARRRVSVAKPSRDAKRPAETGLDALLED